MKIEKDRVVRLHYSLADDAGNALESSREREPLALLFGHGSIIAGLERGLEGHEAGDRFEVVVAPEDGYGPLREGLEQRVPKKHFKQAGRLKPGMTVVVQTRQGARPVTVKKVGMSVVDIDMNHPMAGMTLHFDIEVVEVREATEEEIKHGHVHGAGGVVHD